MRVTDVLLNFRSALVAVVPAFERVNIPWRRPDAYDNWDAVASELFQSLVVNVFQWSLVDEEEGVMRLPAYDLLLDAYADLSTIDVVHRALMPGRWAFHAFGTKVDPFDVVEVRHLSEKGTPLSGELETCPVEGAQFALRLLRSQASTLVDEFAMSSRSPE